MKKHSGLPSKKVEDLIPFALFPECQINKVLNMKPKNCIKCGKPFIPRKPRERICVKCGKPFIPRNPWTSQKFCHSPCRPESRVKYKHHCDICGRIIKTRILPNSSEEALCSFCIEKKQAEKRQQKEREKAKTPINPRKCEVCGNYAFLVRHTKLCRACFTKSQNPKILDCREVG